MMISNPELWKRMSWVLKMSLLLPVHASLSCSVSCSETIAIPREIRHVTWEHLRRCLSVEQVGASSIVLTVWAEGTMKIQCCLFPLLPNRLQCQYLRLLVDKGKGDFHFLFEALKPQFPSSTRDTKMWVNWSGESPIDFSVIMGLWLMVLMWVFIDLINEGNVYTCWWLSCIQRKSILIINS